METVLNTISIKPYILINAFVWTLKCNKMYFNNQLKFQQTIIIKIKKLIIKFFYKLKSAEFFLLLMLL